MDNQSKKQIEEPVGSTNRRVERIVFEMDRQMVTGDLTLPPAGYQSRFSDALNRADFEFVPLTNAMVASLEDSSVTHLPFVVLSKRHIRIAYPAEQD